jgi:hypothetical protein
MPNIFEWQQYGIPFDGDSAFATSASASVLIHRTLLYVWRQVAGAPNSLKKMNNLFSHRGVVRSGLDAVTLYRDWTRHFTAQYVEEID